MLQYTLNGVGVLALLLQVVLPLVVALVTNSRWTSTAKGVMLLVLTAVTQFLTLWYQDRQNLIEFDWKTVLFNVVIAFIISVGSYFGLLRATALRQRLAAVGDKNATDPSVRRVA